MDLDIRFWKFSIWVGLLVVVMSIWVSVRSEIIDSLRIVEPGAARVRK
jgi:hypothetical protein